MTEKELKDKILRLRKDATKETAVQAVAKSWKLRVQYIKEHELSLSEALDFLDEFGLFSCGLCKFYFTKKGCYGCPVLEKTGAHRCNNVLIRKKFKDGFVSVEELVESLQYMIDEWYKGNII